VARRHATREHAAQYGRVVAQRHELDPIEGEPVAAHGFDRFAVDVERNARVRIERGAAHVFE
jgi:hypothetical protein